MWWVRWKRRRRKLYEHVVNDWLIGEALNAFTIRTLTDNDNMNLRVPRGTSYMHKHAHIYYDWYHVTDHTACMQVPIAASHQITSLCMHTYALIEKTGATCFLCLRSMAEEGFEKCCVCIFCESVVPRHGRTGRDDASIRHGVHAMQWRMLLWGVMKTYCGSYFKKQFIRLMMMK